MSTQADAIALRSLLFLSAALALALVFRFGNFDFVKDAVARGGSEIGTLFQRALPDPSPVSQVRKKPVVVAEREIVAITPIPVPRITRLRVEPSKWSAPLRVPPGEVVGVRFSLGRIRVERDGIVAGTLFRNPTIKPGRNGITLSPLASLDRTPRVFWFEKGIRVVRLISLEKQTEEVEVLWKRKGGL